MFALLLALAAPSWASGIDVPTVGTGLSGPTAADPAAVYWNPAMLGHHERPTLLAGAGFVGGVIGYTRNRLGDYQFADTLQFQTPIPETYLDPSRSGPAETVRAAPLAPTGDLWFASGPIADVLTLGAGVYVPYAAPLSFPGDGPQRFQLQKAFIAVTHLSGAASLAVHETLHLGLGLTGVSGLGSISRVQDFAGVDPFRDALANPPINQPNPFGLTAPSTVRELDVLARPFTFTDGTSLGIDFSAGLAWQPTDGFLLGASYQHGSWLRFQGEFAMDMDHPFFTTDLAAQGLAYDPLVTGTGELAFRLPGRVILGTSVAASDRIWLDTQVQWVRYSVLDAFRLTLESPQLAQPAVGLGSTLRTELPRSWVDTIHVEQRVRAQVSEPLGLAGTLGYHSPASPDRTIDVASPDGHRLIGAANGALRLSDRTQLIGDLEVQTILPRTVRESDFDLGNGRYTVTLVSALAHLQVALGSAP